MDRITIRQKDGSYAIPADKAGTGGAFLCGEAAERLAAFENVYEALRAELLDTEGKLDELRGKGKANSVTFRQLLGKKINDEKLINLFSIYGIEEGE